MNLKAEQLPETELDHIRDTLTGIVSYASKSRSESHKRFDFQDKEIAALRAENAEIKTELKVLGAEVTEVKAEVKALNTRFDKLEARFDKLEARFDKLEARFDSLELLIRQSISSN